MHGHAGVAEDEEEVAMVEVEAPAQSWHLSRAVVGEWGGIDKVEEIIG